jgi:L-iditol 2-dehydrogenase
VHLGSDVPGAFAERLALPANARVHAVPDALPTTAAVLAEPMACALHAVRRAGVRPGDRVAVAGLGGLGALAVHAARAEGAAHVTAVVRSDDKARRARDLGYDDAVVQPDDGAFDTVTRRERVGGRRRGAAARGAGRRQGRRVPASTTGSSRST